LAAAEASVAAPLSSSSGEFQVPSPLPPLDVTTDFVTLPVSGFRDAVVAVPTTKNRSKSVVVALHGNFDRPEWQCETWRRVTQGSFWIVCPRGIPRRDAPRALDRWEWGSLANTKAEILASLSALRARFPEHVDRRKSLVLIGFSLGAILGIRFIADQDLAIRSAVFIEGGYQGWTKASAAAAANEGFGGVLFACGQTECRNAVRHSGPLLEKAGLRSALVEDLKAGHDYGGVLAELIQKQFWQFQRDTEGSAGIPLPFR
jgi:dienelactone hydrolase